MTSPIQIGSAVPSGGQALPYSAFAEALRQPVWIADANGAVEYVNRRWTEQTGLALAQSAQSWMQALSEHHVEPVRETWRRVLSTGDTAEIECELCGPGGCRWYRLRLLPLEGKGATAAKWIAVWDDIDAQKRNALAATFMAEAGRLLASSLDHRTTLAALARLAVPALADCCIIDLLADEGGLRQVAASHVDPEKEALVEELRALLPYDPGSVCGIAKVLSTGQPELVAHGTGHALAPLTENPDAHALFRRLGARSHMIIPLIARDRRLGALTFVITESERCFGAEDLALAQGLAHRAALAVDHALLYEAAQAEISRRAQTEEALRRSQELFTKAFAACPDAITISRVADGRMLDVNETFLQRTGYPRADVIGRTSIELGLWENPGQREQFVAALAEHGQARDLEVCFRTKAGLVWALLSAQIIEFHGEPHVLAVSRDITERKRHEEAMWRSADRFKAQYKGLPVPTYTWRKVNRDFFLVDYNDAAEEMTHGAVANLLGKTLDQVYGNLPEALADFARCFDEKTVVRREGVFHLRSINETGYFIVTYVYVPPNMVMVHTEDVRARREADEHLRRTLKALSDAKFAIDQAAIVAITDAKGTITDANDKFCEISKYAREELLGQDHRIINSGYHPRQFFRDMWCTISRGRVWHGEIRNRSKDGSHYWVDTTIVPFMGADGRPFQYTSIRFDITARKLAEQRIEFQAHLLDVVGEAVIATNLDGKVLYWNRFAEKLYGWRAEEALGRNISTLTPTDSPARQTELVMLRLREDEAWTGEYRVQRKDGSELVASVTKSPILDDQGEMIGVIGVSADITERKRLEQDLIKVQKLESVGVLAGGIAHDFNNILTAILGNVALAKMYLRESDKSYEVLTDAEKAFQRARDLTQQLLTFAKGGAPIRKAGSLVTLLAETPRFALTGSNVRCESAVPEDLWPASFDAGQISQALHNLVINAKQAMPTGGVINIEAENLRLRPDQMPPLPPGDYVRITVRDHGVGIAREHLNKIFDPYFTTKQQGSGLGLATTYSIIKKHGGHITAESGLGRGATFHIYLPALGGAAVEAPAQSARPAPGAGRVLLMDDEESIRQVAGRLLGGLGYEVDFAADGAEALQLYQAARDTGTAYAAVILDLTVPDGMGGEECIKRLRALDPEVRAVVSSGYSNDRIMADYEKFGFTGMVAKPYQLSELSLALQQALRRTHGN